MIVEGGKGRGAVNDLMSPPGPLLVTTATSSPARANTKLALAIIERANVRPTQVCDQSKREKVRGFLRPKG